MLNVIPASLNFRALRTDVHLKKKNCHQFGQSNPPPCKFPTLEFCWSRPAATECMLGSGTMSCSKDVTSVPVPQHSVWVFLK